MTAIRTLMAKHLVRADRAEQQRRLPGDELIPTPLATLTNAVTIGVAPEAVWPWLVQMGAGSRAGWYSYDLLDNGRRPSATAIIPELQAIDVGTVFPAVPGMTDGFTVLAFEPCRSLVLGWKGADGTPNVTWAFTLDERPEGATRLIVRVRGGQDYRFHGLPPWVSRPLIHVVHFVMQRRQLLGIAQRAESSREGDELLDRFIPLYDVVERHHIGVSAPAAVTLAAAREQTVFELPLVKAIVRAREVILGAAGDDRPQPRGLLAATQALGWGVLAEVPDREVVVGAVTRPWEANVTFRALPPSEFKAFSEPGFVKIAWTLRADPVDGATDPTTSIFRTETRAVATDATARARFRRYWMLFSPGIRLIRRLSLRPLKREAEGRQRQEVAARPRIEQVWRSYR